jgi:hypothetical protein
MKDDFDKKKRTNYVKRNYRQPRCPDSCKDSSIETFLVEICLALKDSVLSWGREVSNLRPLFSASQFFRSLAEKGVLEEVT